MTEAACCEVPLCAAPGRVMTPRPATDRLIAEAAERIPGGPARVADVGTGSGVIAVRLARLAPEAEIWASDVSTRAVTLARTNARRHGVSDRVHVVKGDLLTPLPGELDLIVANLPYLPAADRAWYPELAGEPGDAVFAPGDGLGVYRRLLRSAEGRLRGSGAVIIQLHRRVFCFEHEELAAVSPRLAELVPDARRAVQRPGRGRGPAAFPATT